MKKILVLLLCFGLSGCYSLGNLDKLRMHNRQNLMKLNIGMTKGETLDIMGAQTATDYFYS